MRRITLFAILAGAAAIAALGGVFYWEFLRGIGPALNQPPKELKEVLDNLKVPDGFEIGIFAKGLGAPRVIARDPIGTLLASVPDQGKLVALPDEDSDGIADQTIVVAEGLTKPHGFAFDCRATLKPRVKPCKLYVAEEDKVTVFTYDANTLKATNKKTVVPLPAGGNHVTRTLLFRGAPFQNQLLISVGSSCNVCQENDSRRAKILYIDVDNAYPVPKVFAQGLRNSVFMTLHPVTGKIWATEMGRDLLGDNLPPDEINIIEQGKNYGWPTCYGGNLHDTAYDKNTYIRNPCMEPFEIGSWIDVPAHSAPLGIAFVPEEGWPAQFSHHALVAYHGSWNRSEPTGYKIVRYKLDAQGVYFGEEDFVTGWLKDGKALGRPVGVIAEPGGNVYISDDKAGVIYKMRRTSEEVTAKPDPGVPMEMDLIRLDQPKENSIVKNPLIATGLARGFWYFEASFPVKVLDANGKQLGIGIAQAQSDWMTIEMVPFMAKVEYTTPTTDTGWLVLQKDNPSGLPENDREMRYAIRFR